MRKDVDRLEVVTERFSKIGSAPDLTAEKLYHTLRATVLYLRPRLPGRVRIDVLQPEDPDLQVPLNRALFSWVVENLIRNAVEAMSDAPRRLLTISTLADQPGFVRVTVADTGPGVSPEVAEQLFKAFVSTKSEGMGLGLSICRTIVEANGGRIWMEPAAGGGTRFHFTLIRTEAENPDGR